MAAPPGPPSPKNPCLITPLRYTDLAQELADAPDTPSPHTTGSALAQLLLRELSWDREQGAHSESFHTTSKKINSNAQRKELL